MTETFFGGQLGRARQFPFIRGAFGSQYSPRSSLLLLSGGEDVAKSRSWKSVVFVVWRKCGPVNFGAVEISKEKTVEAMCDEFSKGI